MFYSKTTGGFYSREIHGDNIPKEAVEITKTEHISLLEGQSKGMQIVAADDGRPVLASPPKETADQVWVRIKAERDRRQLNGGVQIGEHWFLSSERAIGEYNSLISASQGQRDDTVMRHGWRTMNGTEVDMTPALARKILLAGFAQRCAIDDVATKHRAAMEASTDPSSYDFSVGWPKVFGE